MNESLEDENSMIRPDQELIVTVEEPMLAVLRQKKCIMKKIMTMHRLPIES